MSNMFIHVVTYQALQPVLEQTIVANGRFFLYAGYNMVRLIGHIVLCFVFVLFFLVCAPLLMCMLERVLRPTVGWLRGPKTPL